MSQGTVCDKIQVDVRERTDIGRVVQAVKNRRSLKTAAVVLAVFCAVSAAVFPVRAQEPQEDIFTEEERAYIEKGETLKVGYVNDRRPISFQGKDGELAGISRYLFDRIAEISGLKFDYVELPGGDITYDYLMEEKFDLVTGVEYNQENHAARGILLSNPYLSSRKVIVAKEGLVFDPDADFTVAISTGSQTIRKVINRHYPNFKLVDYPSMEACLDAVRSGEADLLIQNQYVVEYWLYKPIYNKLMAFPVLEMNDQLCFSAVVPLQETEDEDYRERELQISIIDKAIDHMSDREVAGYVVTATLENMYEYTIFDFMYQYRYTLILLGLAVILICVLLYVALHARIRSINARADAKAKGDFLSAMSHEIRTPLNGLISLNYLMSQNVDDRERISDYLKQSSAMAQYLLSLMNNILDMSKLQEGELVLERDPFDLSLLLETVDSAEKRSMEELGIGLRTDVELTEPRLLGDAVRIQQVLLNLLDNACKYTDRGGCVLIRARQTKTSEGKILTEIQVADNGRGMSEEFQKKIFAPFTQERETVSQGNQGTGLGLSICALLAERMGGDLRVESRLEQGSRFTFTFLADRAEPDAFEDGTKRQRAADASPTGQRILIAEDNELNGQILAELLEGEGFEVLHVENGKKALEVFQNSEIGEFGVILMDLLMPEMNGFEATQAIRALDRPDACTVKIFASTANTFQEDRDRAFQSGMDDFIAKPINIRELLKKLRF